jgi:hypothetical protein
MLLVVTVHGQQPKHSGWQMDGTKIHKRKSSILLGFFLNEFFNFTDKSVLFIIVEKLTRKVEQ